MLNKKTWSRETALALLLLLGWSIYKENVNLVEVIVWPFMSYAAVAFGLKRVDDSDKLFGTKPPETPEAKRRDSERSGRGGEQPDNRSD